MYTTRKEESKNQESVQSSTTPDPGHNMGKYQNTRKYNTLESCELPVSFSWGNLWIFVVVRGILSMC